MVNLRINPPRKRAFRDDIQIPLRVADRGGGYTPLDRARSCEALFRIRQQPGARGALWRRRWQGEQRGKGFCEVMENSWDRAQAGAKRLGGPPPESIPQSVCEKYRRPHYLQEMLGLSFANSSKRHVASLAVRCLNFPPRRKKRVTVGTRSGGWCSLRAHVEPCPAWLECRNLLRLAPYQFMSLRLAVIVRIFPHRLHRHLCHAIEFH